VIRACIIYLSIAYGIEFLQLTNLHQFYPENYKRLFGLLLGSSVSTEDMVAYTLGIVCAFFIEYGLHKHRLKKTNRV
jgi:hypothetical protein